MGTRSSISKSKPEWSEGLIQRYLSGFFSQSTKKYEMDGLYVFAWESDKLIITRSGWTYEFEIKISRSDFKNDFKHKVDKHIILSSSFDGNKYMPLFWEYFEKNKHKYPTVELWEEHCRNTSYNKNYFTDHYKRPNYFYYAVPDGLIDVSEVPQYAGLIYVRELGGFTIVKKAPKLHEEKYSECQLNLAEKFYYNMVNWRHTAINWQKRYEECRVQLRKELDMRGQDMPYDEIKHKMDVAEAQARIWERENTTLRKDANFNHIERRLLIMEIRKYNPSFMVDGITEQAEKQYNEIYKNK